MDLIKKLRQQRTTLMAEAANLFAGESLTAEQISRDDAISAELADVDAQIARTEAHMERQRVSNDVLGSQQPVDKKKFSGLGEQMIAVARAGQPQGRAFVDPRLIYTNEAGGSGIQAATGLSEGVAVDGGFLVDTDFVPGLLQNVYENGEIASRIRKIGVGANSNGIRINGVDETSRVNGSRWGGIQMYWTGEAQLKTPSQPKFKRLTMELDKLTGLCYATDELLQDSAALEEWLKQAFSDEMTFKLEDAIVNGNGSGMPLGFLNSGAVITVAKEASQANATIVAENILKMWSRMPARLRKNSVFLANQDVEPQLYQLNVKIKNVAGTENVGGIAIPAGVVYTPAGMNGVGNYGTLMGRPVIPVEYLGSLGTPGDIVLVDLSQYLGIDKGPLQSASSIHVRFIYDETCFRFVYRFNGQPIWSAAMTPYKGTNTQSPFIVLAQR